MEEKALYNSRVINTFLEYLRNTHPDIDIEALLIESGITSYEVADEGHWLLQRQVDNFHNALLKQKNDPAIFREAGRFMASSRSISAIRQFIMGFLSPIQAYAMLGKIASYLNRGTTFQIKKLSRNKIEIVCQPIEGVNEKPYQCENRMGSLEAVAKLFTNEYPSLEHSICIHQGGCHCKYLLSWEEPVFLKWKRNRNYIAILTILIFLLGTFILPIEYLLVLGMLLFAVITGTSFYAGNIEKKDIYARMEMHGNAADRLLEQIRISYNNALLVQEIGQAVSSMLDIDKLLKYVTETLQKRLDFDRGMIMLVNPDRTKLVYVNGYGYNAENEQLLRQTNFHINNPESKGPLVKSFREQQPLLINNINEFQEDISSRSLDFVTTMGVKSFICVPIIYEGISVGVLAVDNYRSNRPLNQSEVSLLMGIAPQIAVSLNNAKSLRQIMESEERFRALSENSPDIIYTLDNHGVITYINPVLEVILGYRRNEVIGRYFYDIMQQDDVEAFLHLFNRVKQGSTTKINFEGKILTKDGAERLFDISGAPNFNASGEMTGIVGTLKDVTEQRNLEHQLHHASKMNALGTLTGGISHDFNNIVQAIGAYNQLLAMKKTESDPDWKYLMNIKGLTQRATDLIKQLLLFSRKVESKLVPLDINEEIKSFYELLRTTLPKAITLTLDLADDLQLVNGDSGQLGQVIMNLTVNAKDAMSEGGELLIQTRNVELKSPRYQDKIMIQPGRYALIRISDTGCGIDRETREHIFEPFFTTKEAGKGTGIGLSVVYGIVKNHNGYIFCTSELGIGTVFEFYFPALDLMTVEGKNEIERRPDLSPGHETILLVDDEAPLLETGQELLTLLGYHVLTADSGENALALIERERENVALVILDLMMPGMGGAKCLTEILKIVPAMHIIIASGYSASIKTENILSSGAAAFIQKPYRFEDLSKKIREILDGVNYSS